MTFAGFRMKMKKSLFLEKFYNKKIYFFEFSNDKAKLNSKKYEKFGENLKKFNFSFHKLSTHKMTLKLILKAMFAKLAAPNVHGFKIRATFSPHKKSI